AERGGRSGGRCGRLSLGEGPAGEGGIRAERDQGGDEGAPPLAVSREEGLVGRHPRAGGEGPRGAQVDLMPDAAAAVAHFEEVGTLPARADEEGALGTVERTGRPPPGDIVRAGADVLRVAVDASFLDVDVTAPDHCRGGRVAEREIRRRAPRDLVS